MVDNFDEDVLESESSLQNLSEEEVLPTKPEYEKNVCNNNCDVLEGELYQCTSCNLPYHLQCLMENADGNDPNLCYKCTNSQVPEPENYSELNTQNEMNNDTEMNELAEANNELNEMNPDLDEETKPSGLETTETTTEMNKMTETNELKSPIKIVEEKKKKKPTTEGSNFQTKINVGFNHQVPFTPAFFLDYSYNSYNNYNGNYNYSNANNTSSNHHQRQEWARLMYSPYQMEKIRRRKLKEGSSSVIKNEFELAEFIQMCAKNWKNNPGWHPFSPEFAYKILHFADYDPNKALKFMNDPSFNFSCVCDPPTRRYDNKWKPKDRRGQVPTNPYPPPVTLRGYLLRRHNLNK